MTARPSPDRRPGRRPHGDFLATMAAASRRRAASARKERPLDRPTQVSPPGRFARALSRGPADRLAVLAEVKRASPSRGALAPGLDAVAQARAYQDAGAAAVSVLTEPDHFRGSLDDLRVVAESVTVPVLRKDFLVDAYQVREAAAAGAAAVLLIVAALDDDELRGLLDECSACGLDALVECHDESDLDRGLATGARLIGANNRDLSTLHVDLAVTERLARLVPPDVTLVAESGIRDRRDAARLHAAGAAAILVGEALVCRPREELARTIADLGLAGHARTPASDSGEKQP